MPRNRLMLFAALYAGLSGICVAAPHVSALRSVFGAVWAVVWLLGPPVLLVHQSGYALVYLVGTAPVAAGAYLIARAAKDSPEVGVVTGVILAAIWCFFGVLVYVPDW